MKKEMRKTHKAKSMRALITDAVVAVLLREGSAKVSVELIAQEAGLSKGGVFYYYPNKHKLLLSVLDRYLENFYARRIELIQQMPVKSKIWELLDNLEYEEHPENCEEATENDLGRRHS